MSVTSQSALFSSPFQVMTDGSPNFTTITNYANVAPTIASFAFSPFNNEIRRVFKQSLFAKIYGFEISGTMGENREGLGESISSFRAVNRKQSASYKMQIYSRKKYFSSPVLNANTLAAGGANQPVTAVFNIAAGGTSLSDGDILRVITASQDVLVRVRKVSVNGQLQTVRLTNTETGITLGVITTTDDIIVWSRSSGAVQIGQGLFDQSQDLARTYELQTISNTRENVFRADNLYERKWYQFRTTGEDTFANMLTGNEKAGDYQFWLSDALLNMGLQEMYVINQTLHFGKKTASQNPNAYPELALGDVVPEYDGVVTQIENLGYRATYVLGSMTKADFGAIFNKFLADNISGNTFEVSGGQGWIQEAQTAMAQGTTQATLLNVEAASQNNMNPNGTGRSLAYMQGFSQFIEAFGGTFAWKELPAFTNDMMKGLYYNKAIVVPLEQQSVSIDGVKTDVPSILFAYAGDSDSPLLNRSEGEYSGRQGIMPFLKTYIFAHPEIAEKVMIGGSATVSTNIQNTTTGNMQYKVAPHCPVVTCIEATAMFQPQ